MRQPLLIDVRISWMTSVIVNVKWMIDGDDGLDERDLGGADGLYPFPR